jgi:AbrB family looped-hinge helix DNA binding protein
VVNRDIEMTEIQSTFLQNVKSQGRIVIPKLVREALCIGEGDSVTVTVRKTKEVQI